MEYYYTHDARLAQIKGKGIVAIDVSKGEFCVRITDDRTKPVDKKAFKFIDDMNGYNLLLDYVKDVKEKNQFQDVVFAMEPTGSYWKPLAFKLQMSDYLVCLVNQKFTQVATEMVTGKPNKSDPLDPLGIALQVSTGSWYNCYLPEGVYAEARVLWNAHETLTEEKTRNKNRLHDWLGLYLKGYEEALKTEKGSTDSVFDAHSRALLKKAHFPEQIIALGVDGILNIWKEAGLSKLKDRAELIVKNVTANKDYSFSQGKMGAEFLIKGAIQNLESEMNREKELDKLIDKVVNQIGYLKPVLEIKGIGNTTALGIAGALGDITRFKNSSQIISIAGTDPRLFMSGKHKGEVHISKTSDGALRTALYRVLTPLLRCNPEFKAIRDHYKTRADNPLKAIQANIVMVNKLIRVLFAIMTRNEKFDVEKMLGDIKRVNNPKTSAAVCTSEKLYQDGMKVLQQIEPIVPKESSKCLKKTLKAMKGLVARAEKGSIIQGADQACKVMSEAAAAVS